MAYPDDRCKHGRIVTCWDIRDTGFRNFPIDCMNYFAHALPFLQNPYFVAGVATPDWLSVVDRKCRARAKLAAPFITHEDPRRAALASGIVQHHHDDNWFHQTDAFGKLQFNFTRRFREALPGDTSMRPGFLGHIVVELLLDAILIEQNVAALDAYYHALDELDAELVGQWVSEMATIPAIGLPYLIDRFREARFLYDYLDDAKLLSRINGVLRRVKLSELPTDIEPLIAAARKEVRQMTHDLYHTFESSRAIPRS